MTVGYPALFVLIAAESAGVPVPGEAALITAAILAHMGDLQIELVIAVAGAGAIAGDNVGYLIGRIGADACSNGRAASSDAAGRSW